jgi:hypothetical protein
MNVSLELRNEANGVYERQPEDRYQRLLLVGADAIDDLRKENDNLRMEIKGKNLEISLLKDEINASRSIVKSLITRLKNIAENRTACEIVAK